MKVKLFLSASLLAVAVCGRAGIAAPERARSHVFRYTNPIIRDASLSMRDHCIIKVGAQWFCTGTSNPVWTGPNPGVRLLVSDDLINWRHHSWLIDTG